MMNDAASGMQLLLVGLFPSGSVSPPVTFIRPPFDRAHTHAAAAAAYIHQESLDAHTEIAQH
jgi:hypothetical protein